MALLVGAAFSLQSGKRVGLIDSHGGLEVRKHDRVWLWDIDRLKLQ
jgi:hypothetical protein